MDITGKLKENNDEKEFVIVTIHSFMKYILLHHTLNIDKNNTIEALKNSMSLFGVPSRIISDEGIYFGSKEFKEF